MKRTAVYQISTGTPRRVYGARDTITRAAHGLVVQTTDGDTAKGAPTGLWVTDLRRGRLNIYGGLLRFIDHLHAKGVPLETALLIPAWLESFIREVWGSPAEAGQIKRAA